MLMYDFLDGRGHVPAYKHPNGGGMVAETATVAPTVFLSSDSSIFGHAVVKDNVRITGGASIQGDQLPGNISTLIEDDVAIVGPVKIRGAVLLRNQAKVRGPVSMSGMVQVMHHATVAGNVRLEGDVMVLDSAYISGNVRIVGVQRQVIIRGEEVIHGDIEILQTADAPGGRTGAKTARKPKGADSPEAELADSASTT